MKEQLSQTSQDAIKEVLNIGTAHAAKALSQMIHARVNISIPYLCLDTIENIPTFFGTVDALETCMVTRCTGDMPILLIDTLPQEHAQKIQQHIIEELGTPVTFEEMGDALAASYMSVLEQFLQITIERSPTVQATDMIGALLNSVLAELGQHTDSVLAGRVSIAIPEIAVEGNLFLLFTPDSSQILLSATTQQLHE